MVAAGEGREHQGGMSRSLFEIDEQLMQGSKVGMAKKRKAGLIAGFGERLFTAPHFCQSAIVLVTYLPIVYLHRHAAAQGNSETSLKYSALSMLDPCGCAHYPPSQAQVPFWQRWSPFAVSTKATRSLSPAVR